MTPLPSAGFAPVRPLLALALGLALAASGAAQAPVRAPEPSSEPLPTVPRGSPQGPSQPGLADDAPLPGTSGRDAPVAGQPDPDSIGPVKLRNESVSQVLNLLEQWTGRTLLRPPALPGGSYTLTLPEGVTRAEAVRALESLLNLHGIALAPMGDDYLKVTPLNLARTESPEFVTGSLLDLPPSGRIASKLFTLGFLRVSEFLPQIAAILNPGLGAAPVLFEKSNSALVTDSISNLQRIEALLAELDRPSLVQNTVRFYPLRSAKASNVVDQLRTFLGGPLQMQLGATTSYQADDRTNQVILFSDPRQLPFFDELIARLDVEADPNTRNEVIFLKNADATEVATLLSELVSGRNEAQRTAGAPGATPGNPDPAAPNGAAAPMGPVTAPVPARAAEEFSELVTILADKRSNAVIVGGTNDDIRLLRRLIEQIDVLLAQVRIEVVIAEVTLGDEATSGISALGLAIRGNKLVGFSGEGAGFSVTSATLTKGDDGSTELAADIGLSTTPRRNNTTILSVPAIITTHNKEGRIFVGEQRPVISSYLNDAAVPGTIGTGYRSTVTSKDIGIELVVKPLIGNDGSVQLEITQEVNDVLGDLIIDGNAQPRIGRRSTKSFISAKSGEIIVLGGLQRTARSRNTNRLGPIPLIGDLLGTRRREDTRTDLVFFLRPYVLTNTPADNADALRRIDAGPQRDHVRAALDPAFAPEKKSMRPWWRR